MIATRGGRLRRLGGALSGFGLAIWLFVMTVVCATLLGRHLIALPRPAADVALERAMESLRGTSGTGQWMTVHVLYAECLCSQRIADHVLASRRPEGVTERVLLIGHDAPLEARLASAKFPTTVVSEDEAATRFHVVAAPSFLVLAPDGTVRYVGGYTDRKQGLDAKDLAVVADTRAGREVSPLPIFGCAVSARLRAALNPLGIP
jgi:hypothetical protein